MLIFIDCIETIPQIDRITLKGLCIYYLSKLTGNNSYFQLSNLYT